MSSRQLNDGTHANREEPSGSSPVFSRERNHSTLEEVRGRNDFAWTSHGDAEAFFIRESPSSAAS